jgi:hypothetical protein
MKTTKLIALKGLLFMSLLLVLPTKKYAQQSSLEYTHSSERAFSHFYIKAYPIWLINGIKLEGATNLANNLEANVGVQMYYRSFYWVRGNNELGPFPYYVETDGFGTHLSLDYRFGYSKNYLGLKGYYRDRKSPYFELNDDGYLYTDYVRQHHKDFITSAIYRFRSSDEGFFVELSGELGAMFKTLEEEQYSSDSGPENSRTTTENYVQPYFNLGFALGFAF